MEDFAKLIDERIGKSIKERQGNYLMVVTSVDNVRVIICFRQGHFTYYAKIVLEKDSESLNCIEAEYNPHGLYVFSNRIDDLVEKVFFKAKMLVSRLTNS
ncbi:MAG: hypothetical protein QXE81_02965 [Desulfurococcaceae archaeon]